MFEFRTSTGNHKVEKTRFPQQKKTDLMVDKSNSHKMMTRMKGDLFFRKTD